MEGIVTGIRLSTTPSENIYTMIFGGKVLAAKSAVLLSLYDKVEVKSARRSSFEQGEIKIGESATDAEYGELIQKLLLKAGIGKKRKPKIRIKEFRKPTEEMLPRLEEAALEIARHYLSGAPIAFRFHNDCDGSSGAVAMHEALMLISKRVGAFEGNISWRMNRSVGYLPELFHSDSAYFNSFSSIEKPLIFITDFGTTEESEESMNMCTGKYQLAWIDHHPPYPNFPRKEAGIYINPWDFGSGSDYTAGFLTSVLAGLVARVDVEILKEASLIGDYSEHADRENGEAHKIAIVLDYLTSIKMPAPLTPEHIESIIRDSAKLSETFALASSLLSEAIELGMRKAKRYVTKDKLKIYVLDFRSVMNDSGYPMPGRYSSWLQDELEKSSGDDKIITLVHYGNYISVRATKETASRLKLMERIGALKETNDFIHSHGGHNPAFGIRIDKEHVDDVISTILNELGATA